MKICSEHRYVSFLIVCISFLLFLPSCKKHSHVIKKKIFIRPTTQLNPIKQTPPAINIWIHGTRLVRRPMYFTFFESKPCLKNAILLPQKFHLRQVADILCSCAPDKFSMDTFYLFGWSGKLSCSERYHAAIALYEELQNLTEKYKKQYGTNPYIRIITHSHGGNIALQLPAIAQSNQLAIDELILLACPVQQETKHYINSPLFKHAYVLYSSLDLIQVIAPQLRYKIAQNAGFSRLPLCFPPLSERRFNCSDNLVQVKVKMNKRGIMHGEFVEKQFLTALPEILTGIDTWIEAEPWIRKDSAHQNLLKVCLLKNNYIT